VLVILSEKMEYFKGKFPIRKKQKNIKGFTNLNKKNLV